MWPECCGFVLFLVSQNQWLIMRHGSINVVPAAIGLKTTDQTWHYEQWLHFKFAGRKRRRVASPADSKSPQKCELHTNACTTGVGHLLALIEHSSCLRCSFIGVDRTVLLSNQLWLTCSAPSLSSFGDLAGCFIATVVAQLTSGERSAMFARLRRLASVQLSSPIPARLQVACPCFKVRRGPFLCAPHFAARTVPCL